MKFEFDKLSKLQKFTLIAGAIFAIVIYMVNASNLNVGVGVLLLCVLFSYLAKYKKFVSLTKIILLLFGIGIITLIIYATIAEYALTRKLNGESVKSSVKTQNETTDRDKASTPKLNKYRVTDTGDSTYLITGYARPMEYQIDEMIKMVETRGIGTKLNYDEFTIEMTYDASSLGYFSLGSSKRTVKKIQGSPSSIVGNMWFYAYDSVTFDANGYVKGYNNLSGELKIK